jgi:predicted GNAT family N-acyltransferase
MLAWAKMCWMKYEAMDVRFVDINSREYASLCELRYRVFFQDRELPKELILDEHERTSWYAVVTAPISAEVTSLEITSPEVIACGRLTALTADEFQISQMAVDSAWQSRKLGSSIITALLEKAVSLGAKAVILDARSRAIGFYQRFGFQVVSAEFPSAKTGTPHVLMRKILNPLPEYP